MAIELLIENKGKIYTPVVEEGLTWSCERNGAPSVLKFNVLKDYVVDFTEGNLVTFKVDGKGVFKGYVFIKERDKDGIISVTAYDQLRYFKNKDTISYENKTAGELVKLLANDFGLTTGTIEDTVYKIPSRVEENTSLLDMVQTALELTLLNKKEMYVLYDDFGKLNLKNTSSLVVNILINEETGENFNYSSSIDSNTYNKVKLIYENKKTKKRDVYITKDSNNIGKWGVLQYFDTLQEGENGKEKADSLIELYNKKTRNLSVSNVFGDIRVRAGSMVYVELSLGDVIVNNLMLVEKCRHTFKENEHFMDLTLKGGEFVV